MKKVYSLFGIFLVSALAINGCDKQKQPGTGQSDTSVTSTAITPKQPDKVFNVLATVTEIDQAKGTMTIDHEKMEGYMEAMEMPFKVANPAVFAQVSVGSKGHFTIEVTGDDGVITAVRLEK